jgi:hypothetical protein
MARQNGPHSTLWSVARVVWDLLIACLALTQLQPHFQGTGLVGNRAIREVLAHVHQDHAEPYVWRTGLIAIIIPSSFIAAPADRRDCADTSGHDDLE